ncbi:MAG: hypothetical protein ACE5IK_06185 [Acidobacteriota bacterium]
MTLCDAPSGRGGTWSDDGLIVFGANLEGPLARVPAAGGPTTPVTTVQAGQGNVTHRWPWFLPDGIHFLFFVRAGGTTVQKPAAANSAAEPVDDAIFVGSIDGDTPVELFRGHSNAVFAAGHVLFTRDGTLMARPFDPDALAFTGDPFPVAEHVRFDDGYDRGVFAVSRSGVLVYQTGGDSGLQSLEWFDRDGTSVGKLGEPGDYYSPRFSPDGLSVAVQLAPAGDIWIFDVERNVPTRLTFSPQVDISPVWSPSGDRIAFSSSRDGALNLYVKNLDTAGDPEPLLASDLREFATSWSADGRFLTYHTVGDPKTASDIWVLPIADGTDPMPVARTRFDEQWAHFSPDGHWLAYEPDESGTKQVYVVAFPAPGRKIQVSTSGGRYPVWRHDGTEIFYLDLDNTLTAAQVDSDGKALRVGQVTPLFTIRPGAPFEKYDVSADGQRFLVNSAPEQAAASPLTLILNWPELLRN